MLSGRLRLVTIGCRRADGQDNRMVGLLLLYLCAIIGRDFLHTWAIFSGCHAHRYCYGWRQYATETWSRQVRYLQSPSIRRSEIALPRELHWHSTAEVS